MKIQELAIVFILIIFPISLLLSEYTQFQIKTLNLQTEYDSKLTAATYDAIKAFQINAKNETYSAMINPKMENIEASVNAFRNSIKSTFELNGYTEENINNYIPALVFTLYDGFYIYSPFRNINYRYESETNNITGEIIYDYNEPIDGNGENAYGLKAFITYSSRYKKGSTDVVITYALDNYITVEGMVNGEYVSKGGYLVDGITISGENVTYNEVTIETEKLREYLPKIKTGEILPPESYPYIKKNGVKYYLIEDEERIIYISNGIIGTQYSKAQNSEKYDEWKAEIENNDLGKEYYKQAYEFTDWFYNETNLGSLTYGDAYDQVVNDEGETIITKIWPGNTTKIFNDDNGRNVENELSNFNQHRLKVIRRKIEVNLAIAIANYNSYSDVENVFQMPLINEEEWDHITHNISLISFLQGLPIGGKIYNGYTLVTNSESEEVVMEEYIYILGNDGNYHRVSDQGFVDGSVKVDSGNYQGNTDAGGKKYRSAGRLNLDFESVMLANDNQAFYYYPLKNYNASYNSIVMQNKVKTYNDIYKYLNDEGSAELKKAFYTALGRERASKYNTNINIKNNAYEGPQPGTPDPEIPTTYTIIFNKNGGAGGPSTQTKTHGTPITLPSQEPSRTGYTFMGWSTTNDSSVEYAPGSTYTTEGNATLYAVWSTSTYTITFNTNGGIGGPSTQTKTHGTSITLPSQRPSRTGYTFKGWSITNDSSVEYNPGDTYTTEGNAILYAVWENDVDMIIYNANGGTGEPESHPKNSYSNTMYQISTTVPTREGYTFLGWNTDSTATSALVIYTPGIRGNINGLPAGDVTLYAVWRANANTNTYKVIYNPNGGIGGPGEQEKGENSFTIPVSIPTRDGYDFMGWSIDSASMSAAYGPGAIVNSNSFPEGNVTLYAVWMPSTYTIIYNANGGSGAPSSLTMRRGMFIISQRIPVRTGYVFKGWISNTGITYSPGVMVRTDNYSTPNIILTAIWELE